MSNKVIEAFNVLRECIGAKVKSERDITEEAANAALTIFEQVVNDLHMIADAQERANQNDSKIAVDIDEFDA